MGHNEHILLVFPNLISMLLYLLSNYKPIVVLLSYKEESTFVKEWNPEFWNCSAREWPEFAEHIRCDTIEDCEGGKDEENCHYDYDRCHAGGFKIGKSCYKLNQVQLRH